MPTTARTLLCAVPQPTADLRKVGGRRIRRSLHLALAVTTVAGFQVLDAGPAAVATLPSALTARPFAMAPRPVVRASIGKVPSKGESIDVDATATVKKAAVSTPAVNTPAISAPTADAATVSASLELSPEPDQDFWLFRAVIEHARPFEKLSLAKPAPQEMPVEAAEDPDEVIPFNGRNIPRWLVHSILKAAHVTGVDPVYMMTLADVESSLSPEAKAPTSSAQGLFQFIDRTWLETVHLHAADYGFEAAAEAIRIVDGDPIVSGKDREWIMSLRTDAYFSALMAGELIKDVERALFSQGERELAEAELYLAHFLGARSAVQFLEALDQDPNMKASKLFPKAAKANAGLFMEGKGRKRRPVSVAELYNKIDSKIVRRMDRYTGIAPYLTEVTRPIEQAAQQAVKASAVWE